MVKVPYSKEVEEKEGRSIASSAECVVITDEAEFYGDGLEIKNSFVRFTGRVVKIGDKYFEMNFPEVFIPESRIKEVVCR